MDTKLKKFKRRKAVIIALIVMLPALFLVCLYPGMERTMLEIQQKEETYEKFNTGEWWELSSDFVNYAVEASYYMYGLMMQELNQDEIDFTVLDQNGWINDYYDIHSSTEYYAEYTGLSEDIGAETETTEITGNHVTAANSGMEQNKNVVTKNTEKDLSVLFDYTAEKETLEQELFEQDYLAYLLMEYNAYGQITNLRYVTGRDNVFADHTRLYERARESVEQYKNNVAAYMEYGEGTPAAGSRERLMQVCPTNFRVVYLIPKENTIFAYEYRNTYEANYFDKASWTYVDMGVIWIILGLALLVFTAALILPFFRNLETGWEKIFSLSLEIIIGIAMAAISCAVGMCYFMFFTTVSRITEIAGTVGSISIVGISMKPKTIYGILLVLNFFGWAICFFMEYIVAAAFRQFLCGPVTYFKTRFWCGRILGRIWRWFKKKARQWYVYVTEIDISKTLQQNIIKILVMNFCISALFVILLVTRFLGIFGYWDHELVAIGGMLLLVIYHAVLYKLMRKYGSNWQKEYGMILDAAHEMAEGNLNIRLKEEEMELMKPVGMELGRVQQGFSKAVAEEAKSQSMKTELITNVSHDLKTPLTAIITYVDLLKKEDITEEERKSYIATLDQKSQRLKVLIEDLFEVSKANSGTISMNFMEVDVVNLMKQVRLEMEDKIAASGLIFRWNLPEDKVILSLDGQRTYRVFENLLNNILKYSMPNSRVYIDILKNEQEVQVVFKNMSAEELNFDSERLTERFVRGDVSRKTEGSGLGLAIVKSFVELQRGKVEVSVDGDLFKVTLMWKTI